MSRHYKPAIYITLLLCLLALGDAFAQEGSQTGGGVAIDSAMAISPDYLPTRFAPNPTINFIPLEYNYIDSTILHISEYDPLWRISNLYQSLGINGQAHKNMVFDHSHTMGFSMIHFPYPLYFKNISDLSIYDLKTSYTNIDFAYGILSEFSFQATHAQHVRQVDFVFNIDGCSNKGYFIHQEVNRLSLSGLVRYETPNKLYGFLTTYAFNHAKLAENGGLENCSDFTEQDPRDTNASINANLSSYPVMFSNAQTNLNTHAMQFLNYLNIRDKKGHYFGTFSYTLDFGHTTSSFTDFDLNNLYYNNRYYMSTDTTRDSIQYLKLGNTLQWSNYSPIDTIGDQPYFFRFAAGVRHEYVNARFPRYVGNSLTLFARTAIRLFKIWEIYGGISYSLFGYTHNDAMANAGARFIINKKHRNYIGLDASFGRYAPDYFFSHYYGNNNFWDHNWGKQNVFKASAYWTLFGYKISTNFYNLGRYVYLNSQYEPAQLEKPAQILQFQLSAPVHIKQFVLDAELALQHSTSKAITVPLFAGKVGMAYMTHIFKKKLQFRVGVDLFYNTKYYADGYNPIVHQFYSQQFIRTGNYLYLNANIAFRVKRIAFFVRGGNLLAGLFSFHYITTPGYPMEGRSFEVGVNWKFYD